LLLAELFKSIAFETVFQNGNTLIPKEIEGGRSSGETFLYWLGAENREIKRRRVFKV
jgi:hypothetical protein